MKTFRNSFYKCKQTKNLNNTWFFLRITIITIDACCIKRFYQRVHIIRVVNSDSIEHSKNKTKLIESKRQNKSNKNIKTIIVKNAHLTQSYQTEFNEFVINLSTAIRVQNTTDLHIWNRCKFKLMTHAARQDSALFCDLSIVESALKLEMNSVLLLIIILITHCLRSVIEFSFSFSSYCVLALDITLSVSIKRGKNNDQRILLSDVVLMHLNDWSIDRVHFICRMIGWSDDRAIEFFNSRTHTLFLSFVFLSTQQLFCLHFMQTLSSRISKQREEKISIQICAQ